MSSVLQQWQAIVPAAVQVLQDYAQGPAAENLAWAHKPLRFEIVLELRDPQSLVVLAVLFTGLGICIGLCGGAFCGRGIRALARTLLRLAAEGPPPARQVPRPAFLSRSSDSQN